MGAGGFCEDKGRAVKVVKKSCKFFLVGLNDVVLAFLHEYDQMHVDIEAILPFDDAFKCAVVSVEGLAEKGREWDTQLTPTAKAQIPKRPKKVTTAAFFEMVEGLATPVRRSR